MGRTMRTLAAVALALGLLGAACGSDDGADVRTVGEGTGTGTGTGTEAETGTEATGTGAAECEPVGDPAAADTTVGVELREYSVTPQVAEIEAGTITFEASNVGNQPHEFVVVEGDDPAGLPTTDDGAFDEEAHGEENVAGEVERFPSGEDCTGTFDLEPGNYVLLCNVLTEEAGTVESHYMLGMRTSFTVS